MEYAAWLKTVSAMASVATDPRTTLTICEVLVEAPNDSLRRDNAAYPWAELMHERHQPSEAWLTSVCQSGRNSMSHSSRKSAFRRLGGFELSGYRLAFIRNRARDIANDMGSSGLLDQVMIDYQIVDGRLNCGPEWGSFEFYVGMSHA